MDLASPAAVRRLTEQYQFKFRKSLGQNFLVDANIISKIIAAAQIGSRDTIVEIGPGLGAMTKAMAKKAGKVLAIEVDKNLLPILKETLQDHDNVEVIHEDALKVDFDDLVNPNAGYQKGYEYPSGYKIVANLPYYITTPLIMHVLEKHFKFSVIIVMVQEEVARRMVARPGSKDCGALSIAINFYSRPEVVCKVSKNVFVPRPEVGSAVVKMVRREAPPVSIGDQKIFFALVRAAFGQRRKTLLNALSGSSFELSKEQWKSIINEAGLDPSARGETLGIEEFAALARCCEKRSGSSCIS
ncbi:MAG: 16S rRNA (adenine(1518)-N(6)/adenine(1519)-N(6))-dimethyltransferase RsmA [Firmicutes bacterium]|nr:16S rRNA (adenine(1518)-N(6)/adenine(1519)-N(6))-dimethyltransferase RsmA [Bacillota bacterium]